MRIFMKTIQLNLKIRFPVHDINIENIPIEKVIKHIYQS